MTNDVFISEEGLDLKDPPRLVWVRVQDAVELIEKTNPKRHDIGSLMASLRRYGYQEIAKYDATIGSIKAGNGRVEALALMEREGEDPPRGIAVEKETGAWVVPISAGVDAISRSEAFSYLIDSNNLALSGGDFDGFDMARLWDSSYTELIGGLDQLPVTVDADMLTALSILPEFGDTSEIEAPEDFPEYDDDIEVEFRCPKCGYEWSGSAN